MASIHFKSANAIISRSVLASIIAIFFLYTVNMPAAIAASQQNYITGLIDREFLTYENSNLGIKFQYPFFWAILDFKGKVEGYRDVILVPLLENSTELTVYINIANLSEAFNKDNITLNEFTTQRIDSLKESVPNFNITKSNSTMLGGQMAHRIEYSYSNPFDIHETVRGLEIWTLHKGFAYNFNYIATIEETLRI